MTKILIQYTDLEPSRYFMESLFYDASDITDINNINLDAILSHELFEKLREVHMRHVARDDTIEYDDLLNRVFKKGLQVKKQMEREGTW